tara:strand:+ start:273 stop:464 length:192 start_codon:yes stop_codon:yes gene_type:complete
MITWSCGLYWVWRSDKTDLAIVGILSDLLLADEYILLYNKERKLFLLNFLIKINLKVIFNPIT